jgi:type II secretory pathway component PulK
MRTSQQGFIALISVLMLSVMLLGVVISLAQYGMVSRYALLTLEQKEISNALARGCIQVARIAIANDPLYETANKQVSYDDSWCEIVSIAVVGSMSVVRTSASSSGAVTNLEAVIDSASGDVRKIEEHVEF